MSLKFKITVSFKRNKIYKMEHIIHKNMPFNLITNGTNGELKLQTKLMELEVIDGFCLCLFTFFKRSIYLMI